MAIIVVSYHQTSTKTKPNKAMREKILPFFKAHDVKRVLDFGAGRHLRDSRLLVEHGLAVDAVELPEQIKRIDTKKAALLNSLSTEILYSNYDAALLNFVIQVHHSKISRLDIMNQIYFAVKKNGYFVLSVRNKKDVKYFVEPNGVPYGDGFLMERRCKDSLGLVTPTYTFARGYDEKEVKDLLNMFQIGLLEMFKTSDSIIALGQKR